MTAHDLLLLWISGRGSVRSGEVREAIERAVRTCSVSPPGGGGRRDREPLALLWWPLYLLGHVEEQEDGGWRVTPSTAVISRPVRSDASGGQERGAECERVVGRVYGARSSFLLAAMRERSEEFEVTVEVEPQPGGPSIWSLEGDPAGVTRLAEALDLRVTEDSSASVLSLLPSLDSVLEKAPEANLPATYSRLERYDPRASGRSRDPWNPVLGRGDISTGLYRLPGPVASATRHYHVTEATTRQLESRDQRLAAEWSEIRARASLEIRHDPGRAELHIPAASGLPVLLGRALATPTGRCPVPVGAGRGERYLAFTGVDEERAEQVARVLCLPLTRLAESSPA